MAADLHVALHVREALAAGDEQLRLHEIDAGDELRDRMLHLDARVHLDEVELAVLVEELQRAGAAIADRAAGLDAAIAHDPALARGDARRRRLLDDLLVAALHGAVALAEMDHVALAIGEHLELDVPRPFEKLLHVDLIVAECRARLGLRDADRHSTATPRCARHACRGRRRRRMP